VTISLTLRISSNFPTAAIAGSPCPKAGSSKIRPMTHWYRLPNLMSVTKLFYVKKQAFLIDNNLFPELPRHLPSSAGYLPKSCSESILEVKANALLCQESKAILITSNDAYVAALRENSTASWGVILLPDELKAQRDAMARFSAGNLTFRPTRENTDIIEYARRNRTLLDLRADPPILTVHSTCKWKPKAV
jgi:hypothetical protein